jgi:hypothetical protein
MVAGAPATGTPRLKWVFKLKRDEYGSIIRHKARLVAKGYVQRQGIDFDEIFVPVARMESVRIVLAVAAHHGWQVHHMDVKSAFLNGDLAEGVYVAQPSGFVKKGKESMVLKLHKALYGLRQAPRAWNSMLDASLCRLGFSRCNTEHDLYTRAGTAARLIVGVYVDDLLVVGESVEEIGRFKEEMKQTFQMSDLGSLSYYLGIEVKQGKHGIELCQSAYAAKLLDRVGLGERRPSSEEETSSGRGGGGVRCRPVANERNGAPWRRVCRSAPITTRGIGSDQRILQPNDEAGSCVLGHSRGVAGSRKREASLSQLISFSIYVSGNFFPPRRRCGQTSKVDSIFFVRTHKQRRAYLLRISLFFIKRRHIEPEHVSVY